MEKKKFDEYTNGIARLIRVYNETNSFIAAEKLKEDIVEVAERFAREYRGENIAEKKSEMPCNCHEEFFAVPLQHIEDLRKNLEREFNQLIRELKMQKIRLNTFYKIK